MGRFEAELLRRFPDMLEIVEGIVASPGDPEDMDERELIAYVVREHRQVVERLNYAIEMAPG